MSKTITQKAVFKNTSTSTLYAMYLDSKQHAAFTGGGRAKISPKEGAKFSAWNGYILGKILHLIKNKMIVHTFVGSDWQPGTLDSILILRFEQKGKNAIIHLTHDNVPDDHAPGIKKGWIDFYWTPWKKYLAAMS
jgi:activator of HSP90 ATPase